jgi:hypothetical protein
MSQVSLEKNTLQDKYQEVLSDMMEQAKLYYLKDKFLLTINYNKDKFLYSSLLEKYLCTTDCKTINIFKDEQM